MQSKPDQYSKEAEEQNIGAMIFDSTAIPIALTAVGSEDFYFHEHQILFDATRDLYMDKGAVELPALIQFLGSKRLSEIGEGDDGVGRVRVIEIADSVASSASVKYYADIVREKKLERDANKAIIKMQEALDSDESLADRIEEVRAIVADMTTPRSESPFLHYSKSIVSVAENMGTETNFVPTGFTDLDREIKGFRPGELIVLASRTGEGKSTLAAQIALNAAKDGNDTLFVPLEMAAEDCISRLLCSETNVNPRILNDMDRSDLTKKAHEIKTANIPLVFSRLGVGQTIDQVRGLIRSLKNSRDLQLVIVDYLQLLSTSGKTESLRTKICEITRRLKLMAVEEEVAILALSQLKRDPDTKHIPQLSDLKESGSIEQDADMVLMLNRPGLWDDDTREDGETTLYIRKFRRGAPGKVNLVFLADYCLFASESCSLQLSR